MKNFLMKLTLFLLVLLTFYPLLIYFWFEFINFSRLGFIAKSNISLYSYTNFTLKKTKLNHKIMFLGSSHSYMSFDPKIFEDYNFSSFNLGSGLQTPLSSRIIFEKYVNTINPDYVIYEVYPLALLYSSFVCSNDLAFNHRFKNQYLDFVYLFTKFRNIRIINGFFYNNLLEFFDPFLINENKYEYNPRDFKQNYFKGFLKDNGKFQISKLKFNKIDLNLEHENLNDFLKLVDIIIKRYKKKLIFVYAPIPKKLFKSINNHD